MDKEDYWVRKEAEIGEAVEAKFYCTSVSYTHLTLPTIYSV